MPVEQQKLVQTCYTHASMTVRPPGKSPISARLTVEHPYIAAATTKTEEHEKERYFSLLDQYVDQG